MFFGSNSMYAPLRRALVREPDDFFGQADPSEWGYASQPDLVQARLEHRQLVNHLEEAGVEVLHHSAESAGLADSIFVFDPVLITPAGAVILQMGKALRRGESALMRARLEELRIPILGQIDPPGMIEGGDILWLDSHTLAVGLGFRTNSDAIGQLSCILESQGIAVIPFELPFFKGPESCLHLLSLISVLDRDLAVVHLPLLSVPLVQNLQKRGIKWVSIAEDEFPTQASNVLALAPRKVLILEENVKTIQRLQAKGCEVTTYRGREISHTAEGGPTCLVLPLLREKVAGR